LVYLWRLNGDSRSSAHPARSPRRIPTPKSQPHHNNGFGGRREFRADGEQGERIMPPDQTIEVESSGVIDAPLEKLWNLVSDFNNVAQWHPDVAESRLESGSGREAGAVRTVRLRNGMSIREQLVAISVEDHSYKYRVIESPLPMRDHESIVRFTSINASQTRVTWTARFRVLEGDAKAFGDAVKAGVLDVGIDGLRQAALGPGQDA
jgi:hypothetical protein